MVVVAQVGEDGAPELLGEAVVLAALTQPLPAHQAAPRQRQSKGWWLVAVAEAAEHVLRSAGGRPPCRLEAVEQGQEREEGWAVVGLRRPLGAARRARRRGTGDRALQPSREGAQARRRQGGPRRQAAAGPEPDAAEDAAEVVGDGVDGADVAAAALVQQGGSRTSSVPAATKFCWLSTLYKSAGSCLSSRAQSRLSPVAVAATVSTAMVPSKTMPQRADVRASSLSSWTSCLLSSVTSRTMPTTPAGPDPLSSAVTRLLTCTVRTTPLACSWVTSSRKGPCGRSPRGELRAAASSSDGPTSTHGEALKKPNCCSAMMLRCVSATRRGVKVKPCCSFAQTIKTSITSKQRTGGPAAGSCSHCTECSIP